MKTKKHSSREKAFALAEIKERLLFMEFQNVISEVEITNISKIEAKEYWDICFTSGTTHIMNSLCEVKCRKYLKTAFADGWILQEDKLDELQKLVSTPRAKKNNLRALYCNFFLDGVLIWDVTNQQKDDMQINKYNRITSDKSAGKVNKRNLKLKNKDAIAEYTWDVSYAKFDYQSEIIYDFLFPNKRNRL